MNLGVADAGWGTGAGKVTSCRGKGLCLLNLVVLVCSLTALHSSMLLAFTFFYHLFCHPGAARFFFFLRLLLCLDASQPHAVSLPPLSSRLDLVLGAE